MRRASRVYGSQAVRLVADIDHDPWGSVRASLYETARVVSLTPWLSGHEPRLAWLLKQQRSDGSWGEGPAPYRLLPTLSAVEALLSTVRSDTAGGTGRERLAAAAAAGLAALRSLPPAGPWPDTAAIELLVPSLVSQINEHLDQPTIESEPQLGPWSRGTHLEVPHGFREHRHEQIAQLCRSAGVPAKLHHTFEGVFRHVPASTVPVPEGLLGSSPAATAAWLATTQSSAQREPAITALTAVARRYSGLFPEAAPITVFERLWVAAALAGPGLPPACRATVRAWAYDIYDVAGVRGAPGLMPDADDTAMTVLVAALAGEPCDPAPLSAFWSGSHFDCYVGEDTGSVTANAHALQALGAYTRSRPADATHRLRMDLVRDRLLAQQQPDGPWTDKWHASPYYATERCVTALARHVGPGALDAVRSAADWVAASQHDDGAWGVWGGTAEETAYAVKTLLAASAALHHPYERALNRAEAVLDTSGRAPAHRHPALWHDKTLYAPQAMIQAEVMAALEMLRTRHAAEHPSQAPSATRREQPHAC
ncbi:prenyltransferase/squalene oxidase repeat-containing protein [Streptomyces sp. NPDC102441]|uniref:prenyltransferase/squalene oxidase repeat-containing protein n=1 Tax=Streptomyces sp. NPDC102441 TaxID=3366176 RepID=UPI00381C161C